MSKRIKCHAELQNWLICKARRQLREGTASFSHFALAMKLGPILFHHFCKLCEIGFDDSVLMCNVLQAFSCCISALAADLSGHALSKSGRIAALFRSSLSKCNAIFKGGSYEKLDFHSGVVDEKMLIQLLKNVIAKNGLLMEMLYNGLDNEALAFCEMITIAASSIDHPNEKAGIGLSLIRCFELNLDCNDFHGPLSISSSPNKYEECSNYITKAIDSAILLGGNLMVVHSFPATRSH